MTPYLWSSGDTLLIFVKDWAGLCRALRHNHGLTRARMKRAKGLGFRAWAQRWSAVPKTVSRISWLVCRSLCDYKASIRVHPRLSAVPKAVSRISYLVCPVPADYKAFMAHPVFAYFGSCWGLRPQTPEIFRFEPLA